MGGFREVGMSQRGLSYTFTASGLLNREDFFQRKDWKTESFESRNIFQAIGYKMKKLGSNRSLNKVLTKREGSGSSEFEKIKVKTGWTGRLGDARRALSRKTKGFSAPSTSSSTPCLFSTAPPPPKRAPSTTLTLRSKSMTAELEELGECQRAGMQSPYSLLPFLSHFCLPFVIKTWCLLTFRIVTSSVGLFLSFSLLCWRNLFPTKLLLGEEEEVSLKLTPLWTSLRWLITAVNLSSVDLDQKSRTLEIYGLSFPHSFFISLSVSFRP